MKKIFCLILCLCLFTSLAFAELSVEENRIVEKKYHVWAVIPAVLSAASCCYFANNPPMTIDESGVYLETALGTTPLGEKSYDYAPAVISGFVSIFLMLIVVTPKKTYLIPKLDKDGTIWFQKEIKY